METIAPIELKTWVYVLSPVKLPKNMSMPLKRIQLVAA